MNCEHVVATFQHTEDEQLLYRYGEFKRHELPSGDIITVLPTCVVPLPYLIRANWKKVTQMGNFRSVYSVDILESGIHPHLVVKSPERVFTKDEDLLSREYPWWGGPKSLEGRIHIVNHPVVEAQAFWEAIMLLELHLHKIRAEIPQALIQTYNGRSEVVVYAIDEQIDQPFTDMITTECVPNYDDIQTKTGLLPADDWEGQNLLRDRLGRIWIIDVNRWTWPPYTDNFRRNLVRVIQDA